MSNRTDIVVETDNAEGQVLLSASRVYDLTEDKTQDTINSEVKNTLNFLEEDQKHLWLLTSFTATAYKEISISLPAGSYKFMADNIQTTDTDKTMSRVMCMNGSTEVFVFDAIRNTVFIREITLSSSIDKIRFYAADNWSHSEGDTLTVTNLKIVSDTELGKRLDALETWENETTPILGEMTETVGIAKATEGVGKSSGSYVLTNVLTGVDLESEQVYTVTFSITSAITSPVYVYIKNNGTTIPFGGTTIPAGSTSVTYKAKPQQDYPDSYLCFEAGPSSLTVLGSIEKCYIEDKVELNAEQLSRLVINGTCPFDVNDFVNGGINSGAITEWKYRVVSLKKYHTDTEIRLRISSGYRIDVLHYLSGGSKSESDWVQGQYIIPANSDFRITIAKVTEDQSVTANIKEFVNAVGIVSKAVETSISMNGNINTIGNLLRFDKYYSHIGVDKTDDIIIPCQSIADVSRTRRLGFRVLEINVRKTQDNKYVCLHGANGAFGYQFMDTNGNYVNDIQVNSMTLQDIKDTIRFRSKYTKYRVAPYTLQEMLYECKNQGIIPLVEYQPSYTDEIEILDSIMGKNNYLLATYSTDRGDISDTMLFSWLTIANKDNLVTKCKTSGGMYCAGLNVTNSAYSNFTDSDWIDLIDAVHSAGFLLGFVGGYAGEVKSQKLLSLGFDVSGSSWNINDIDYGNICNLYSDIDFSDFTTTGTVSSQTLTLADGDTVVPSTTINSVFLGGGSLHITFSGTIHLEFGDYIDSNFTSDGSTEMWFSTFVEESAPTFTITSSGATTIYNMSYKASKM